MTRMSIHYKSEQKGLPKEFYEELFKRYDVKGNFHSENSGAGFVHINVKSINEINKLEKFVKSQSEIKAIQLGEWEQ